jgi:hypothetical protein
MRLSTLVKLLAVGGGTAIVIGNVRKHARRPAAEEQAPDDIPSDINVWPDPRDVVQGLDEVQQFHVEELGVDVNDNGYITREPVDEIPDNDKSFEQGQHWLEALETITAEDGPEPERSIKIDDEHSHDFQHGSAGSRRR